MLKAHQLPMVHGKAEVSDRIELWDSLQDLKTSEQNQQIQDLCCQLYSRESHVSGMQGQMPQNRLGFKHLRSIFSAAAVPMNKR